MSSLRDEIHHRPNWQQHVVCETFAIIGKGLIITFTKDVGRGFFVFLLKPPLIRIISTAIETA